MRAAAFRVIYNDGTDAESPDSEWFAGVCTDDTIRANIAAGRAQCKRDWGGCYKYHLRNYRQRPTPTHRDYPWCNEARLFSARPTEHSCGVWHRGAREGERIVPAVDRGDVAFITTRAPHGDGEADRFVVAVFRIGLKTDEKIVAVPDLDVRIPREIASTIRFWDSYTDETGAPASKSGRPDWRMMPYRYLNARQRDHLLRRIEQVLGRRPEVALVRSLRTGTTPPPRTYLRILPTDVFGQPYTNVTSPADRSTEITLFARDPAVVERGYRGHQETISAYLGFLKANRITPLKPVVNEPNYDLAWCHGERRYVAEIKSITDLNEETQLRLGLGQVLRYRDELASRTHHEVVAVLVPEREPRDHTWHRLCASLGVLLVWPGAFKLGC